MSTGSLSPNTIAATGWVAAIFSMVSVIPQVLQAFISQSVDDVSLAMYFLLIATNVFWLIYGIGLGSWQLVMSIAIQLISGIIVVGFKIKPYIHTMLQEKK